MQLDLTTAAGVARVNAMMAEITENHPELPDPSTITLEANGSLTFTGYGMVGFNAGYRIGVQDALAQVVEKFNSLEKLAMEQAHTQHSAAKPLIVMPGSSD